MGDRSAIIFGAGGQDGRYLSGLLRGRGVRTVEVARSPGAGTRGDVRDRAFVEDTVRSTSPTYIFQLAANSTTSHDALFENHQTIATGALNVLEAAYRLAPQARVFIVGSGVQFVNVGKPIRETDEFEATNAYSVARIQSVYAARYYRTLGLEAYVGYLFHHDSPLRRGQYVSKQVIEGLERIKQGQGDVLSIGNPTVSREWVFAEDVARGILTLIDQNSTFEAVVGSGEAHTISEWIEACAHEMGLDRRAFSVVDDPTFVSPFASLVSDPATIRGLGWEPRLGFQELAAKMVHGR